MTIAAVLAGLDVLAAEPERLTKLHDNTRYCAEGLKSLGFRIPSQSAIIPIRVPEGMNIRQAAYRFHQLGIFLNSIEYPAVPISQQRFRVSMTADHTRADIDMLVDAVKQVWAECAAEQRCAA
jgi:glycine C-acetyltransferase